LPAVIIPARAEQKKSIISIDNKRMIKLNFQWPVKGRVIRKFAQSHNKGIDIAGKMGKQSVRAAEAGKVVYSGQGLAGFGNLLILKHNDEYLSAYANNSRLLVKEGQQVEKGLIIAEISESESKPAALHFEIRKNGNPVNPVEFLPQ
jgi:lipoprotein NlpD